MPREINLVFDTASDVKGHGGHATRVQHTCEISYAREADIAKRRLVAARHDLTGPEPTFVGERFAAGRLHIAVVRS